MKTVTRLLKDYGLIDDRWFTLEATEKGTNAHEACELHDAGGESDNEYLAAWINFCNGTQFRIIESENRRMHQTYGYTGKPDRYGTIKEDKVVIDIKTGSPQKWHGIQLAAYAMLFDEPVKRLGVYLKPNGRYSYKLYDDLNDFEVWKAILTLEGWKNDKF